jgi:hypothetical protein
MAESRDSSVRWIVPLAAGCALAAVCAMAMSVVNSSGAPAAAVGEQTQPRVVGEAPDSASAVLAARRQGSRVEVLGERSDTHTVFANPDGTHTTEISALPTRVKRGSGWVPINRALVSRPDGSVVPRAVSDDVTLSGGGSAAPLLRMVAGGAALALYWPGELPRPVLSQNAATYPEVLPGVDLVMRAESYGYQQLLVIKTAEAAKNPALARIELRVEERGVRLSADGSGALRAVDTAGNPVFGSPPSVMWDSSGGVAPSTPQRSRSAPVGVVVGDGVLRLLPDKDFLADPATRYPVTIDPTLETFQKSNWATVLEGFPNQRYWWTSGAGPDVAQVGQCNNANGDCNGIRQAKAYFQFNTAGAGMHGKTILEATFRTLVRHSPDCSARAHQLRVVHHTHTITSDTTWNNQPPSDPWPKPPASPDFLAPTTCSPGVGLNVMGALNGNGWTTFMLQAANGGDPMAWRKYDPTQTKLTILWNRPPDIPRNLRTDPPLNPPCRWCGGKSYVADNAIVLATELFDPDSDLLYPKWWVKETGKDVALSVGATQISGATHTYRIDLTNMDTKEFSWTVQAHDTHAESAAFGLAPFVVDRKGIGAAPAVESAAYPADGLWHGAVGAPGTFTFRPGAPCDAGNTNGTCDINHYVFWSPGEPERSVNADALGGNATVTLTPWTHGPVTLHVKSVDRAGHPSPVTSHIFRVRDGDGPRSQWSFEGKPNDSAYLGDRHGTLGGDASYTDGAVGTSVYLSGKADMTSIVTAPHAVRTDASFSVSAWVRPDELPTDRSMSVLSQDGTNNSGWILSYAHDVRSWSFMMVESDELKSPLAAWRVKAPASLASAAEWIHLTGVYDRPANAIRLYVNGVKVDEYTLAANFEPWDAPGSLIVGRLKWQGAIGYSWQGGIDEVKVFDRAVSDAEVLAMVSRDNVQTGRWKFDDPKTVAGQRNTTARNAVAGSADGVLTGGAEFVDNGDLGGAVKFNGVDGQVTAARAMHTDRSFTVSAWVYPNAFPKDPAKPYQSMTAVSRDGTANSGFYLQWNHAGKWMFMRAGTDLAGNTQWYAVAASDVVPQLNAPTHLTGVYSDDGTTRKLAIYVNGELGGEAVLPVAAPAAWDATGPLAIGRAKVLGNLSDFWNGQIDEVRTYNRALAAQEIKAIVAKSDVPAGSWKLDANTTDSSPGNRHGTWSGTPAWVEGQSIDPNPADQAARFTGTNAISVQKAVDTTESFTAAAWVKLDAATGCHCAILSQDATNNSGFSINVGADGRWSMFAATSDPYGRASDGHYAIVGDAQRAQAGVWTHVAGVYHKQRGKIELYVNGVLIATGDHRGGVNATGGFQIGRTKSWWQGTHTYVMNFAGAIDDVKVYSRPLFADEIQVMAGRDSSLVHHWKLNEGSGTFAADSVGLRGGTLSVSTTYTTGRAGGAVRFDGRDDAVSTTGVDLRTDKNFTVTAWVKLDDRGSNPPLGKVVAVSMDGGAANNYIAKFRLGHRLDNNQAPPPGKWIFEMPEKDGTITEAAISVKPSQLNTWVLLVGTYDAAAKRLWLRVYDDNNNVEADQGTLNTPWRATGGVQIGRSMHNGTAGEFWPGSVDDVRLYTGNLDPARITEIFRSYPAATQS